jgi:hypothetical protein
MSRMHFGVHRTLEGEADRLLRESLRGVTRHTEKSDILTPWKQNERRRREVYVPSGTPDAANRQGLFTRSLNTRQTHLNSRDGIAQANGHVASLAEFVRNNGGGSIYDSIIPERQ